MVMGRKQLAYACHLWVWACSVGALDTHSHARHACHLRRASGSRLPYMAKNNSHAAVLSRTTSEVITVPCRHDRGPQIPQIPPVLAVAPVGRAPAHRLPARARLPRPPHRALGPRRPLLPVVEVHCETILGDTLDTGHDHMEITYLKTLSIRSRHSCMHLRIRFFK